MKRGCFTPHDDVHRVFPFSLFNSNFLKVQLLFSQNISLVDFYFSDFFTTVQLLGMIFEETNKIKI